MKSHNGIPQVGISLPSVKEGPLVVTLKYKALRTELYLTWGYHWPFKHRWYSEDWPHGPGSWWSSIGSSMQLPLYMYSVGSDYDYETEILRKLDGSEVARWLHRSLRFDGWVVRWSRTSSKHHEEDTCLTLKGHVLSWYHTQNLFQTSF